MPEDKGYPYSTVPNRLRQVQEKIPDIGRPPTATQAWLKGLGYTSGNDMSILSVMRRVGIIGPNGTPTTYWDAIRSKDGPKIAEHVRAAYADLFALYPNAEKKDDEALLNFFRSNTDAGPASQKMMLRTFKVLCEPGDFSSTSPTPTVPTPEKEKGGGGKGEGLTKGDVQKLLEGAKGGGGGGGLTLNVNIQLQLPASADGEVYEKLFEAMGKHLKGLASIE